MDYFKFVLVVLLGLIYSITVSAQENVEKRWSIELNNGMNFPLGSFAFGSGNLYYASIDEAFERKSFFNPELIVEHKISIGGIYAGLRLSNRKSIVSCYCVRCTKDLSRDTVSYKYLEIPIGFVKDVFRFKQSSFFVKVELFWLKRLGGLQVPDYERLRIPNSWINFGTGFSIGYYQKISETFKLSLSLGGQRDIYFGKNISAMNSSIHKFKELVLKLGIKHSFR